MNIRKPEATRCARAQSTWFTSTLFLLFLLAGCGSSKTAEEHLADARGLQQAGDMAGAILEFKNAVQIDPDSGDARRGLGFAHLAISDYASGLKELQRARKLGVNDEQLIQSITRALITLGKNDEAATELALNGDFERYEWRYLQAMLDLRVGRLEEASEGFAKLVEEKPTDRLAQRGWIGSLLQLGEIDKAKDVLNQAIKYGSQDADIWTMKGELAVKAAEYETAKLAYGEALKIDPDAYSARLGQIVAAAGLQEFDAAEAFLQKLPEGANDDLRVIYLQGIIAEGHGDLALATSHYRSVIQQWPDHTDSLQKLAKLHFQLGEMSRAIEYLEQLSALYPGNTTYRKQLGAAQLAAGRLDNAFAELSDLGVDINKQTDANMLALLGAAYTKQGKLTNGLESLERAHELAPDSHPITIQLALGHLRSNDTEKAKSLLTKLLEEKPDHLTAQVLLILAHTQDEPEKAKSLLETLSNQESSKPLALNIRGFMSMQTGDMKAARADFEQAQNLDASFLPPYFNLARLERTAGDNEAVAVQLLKVLEVDSTNSQALLALGELKNREGDLEQAVKYWELARQNNLDAGAPRAALARHYREAGQLAKAKTMIEEAYEIAPFEPLIQYEYAQIQLIHGNTDPVGIVVDRLAQRFPESPQVMQLQVALSRATGDEQGLVSALKRILEIAPDAVRPNRMLVASLIRNKKHEEARKVADKLLAFEPRIAAAQELHGDIYFAEGELDNAFARYEKAYTVGPNTQLILKLDQLERALNKSSTRLENWLKDHPEDRAVRFQLAANKHATGDISTARETFEGMLEANPENPVVLNNLAWIYHELKDERAIEYAERANTLSPDSAEIMDTYAWILLRNGKVEQALKLLNRAIEISPNNPDIRFHYASALAEVGQGKLAIEELSSVLGDGVKEFASMAEAEALLQSLKSGG